MHRNPAQTLDEQMFEAIVAQKESLVRHLLAGGMDPNRPRNFGRTCLTQAATVGTDAVVRLLIEHGADPNLMDDEGDTALDCAIWEDRDTTVALLLEMGADPHKTHGGLDYLLQVIADRAPDCDGLLDPYVARQQGEQLDENTAPVAGNRAKPRI